MKTPKPRLLQMENVGLLIKYGPVYFNTREYERILKQKLKQYYRFLAKNYFKSGKSSFLDYQKKGLKKMGYSISMLRLYRAFLCEIIDLVFNPKRTIGQLFRSVKKYNRHNNNRT